MGLQPNTSYQLQRAVDTLLDGNCTSIAWLTLGKGLVPQSIVSNNWGSGVAELFRSMAAIPVGSTSISTLELLRKIRKRLFLRVVVTNTPLGKFLLLSSVLPTLGSSKNSDAVWSVDFHYLIRYFFETTPGRVAPFIFSSVRCLLSIRFWSPQAS